jgi:hypothetical protein
MSMRIIQTGEEIAPYAKDRRYAVPRLFTAIVQGESVEVEFDVEMDGDRPCCRRLEVRALGGAEITGDTLRRIPVGRILGEALTLAAWRVERPGVAVNPIPAAAERLAFYEEHASSARRPRRGSPVTEEHLAQVAALYRAALDRGDAPTQAVAETMHAARSTAARWVGMARSRGLLGASIPGRAGEAAPEKKEKE